MGIYLTKPRTEKTSEDDENERLRYGSSSMVGWRASMEDAHAALLDRDSSTAFFGVYDGHGGEAVAKFCAKYLQKQVLEHEAYKAGDIVTSLQKAFLRMDEMMSGERGRRELRILRGQIVEDGLKEEDIDWDAPATADETMGNTPLTDETGPTSPDKAKEDAVDDSEPQVFTPGKVKPLPIFGRVTVGSTACVAAIRNNQLIVANVGDSRCVISRKGQAYNLSRDHKPHLESEKARILNAGDSIKKGRINGDFRLSRTIGDTEFKQHKSLPPEKQSVTADPEINKVELCDDDEFLLIASNGIWECISSQALVDFVRKELNAEIKLSEVCEKVLDKCLSPDVPGKGCDNMTMILVKFKSRFGRAASNLDKPLVSYEIIEPPETESSTESDSDDSGSVDCDVAAE